jgi:hypothetical protein
MARLPTVEDLGQRPMPSAGGRSIAVADLSSVGRSQQQAGAEISQFAERAQADVDEFDVASAVADFNINYAKTMQDISVDNDYANLGSKYNAASQELMSRAMGGVRSEKAKKLLQVRLSEKVGLGSVDVAQIAHSKQKDSTYARYLENSEKNKQAYTFAGNETERARIKGDQIAAAQALKSFGVDESAIVKSLQDWEKSTSRERLLFDLQNNTEDAFKELTGFVKGSGGKVNPNAPLTVRYNNPGALREVGSKEGFRKFNTPQEGLKALRADLVGKISGESPAMKAKLGEGYEPTVANLISVYAPSSENNTAGYIDKVTKDLGISPDQRLEVDDVDAVMRAVVEMEGGKEAVAYYYDKTQPVQNKQYAYLNGMDYSDALAIQSTYEKKLEADKQGVAIQMRDNPYTSPTVKAAVGDAGTLDFFNASPDEFSFEATKRVEAMGVLADYGLPVLNKTEADQVKEIYKQDPMAAFAKINSPDFPDSVQEDIYRQVFEGDYVAQAAASLYNTNPQLSQTIMAGYSASKGKAATISIPKEVDSIIAEKIAGLSLEQENERALMDAIKYTIVGNASLQDKPAEFDSDAVEEIRDSIVGKPLELGDDFQVAPFKGQDGKYIDQTRFDSILASLDNDLLTAVGHPLAYNSYGEVEAIENIKDNMKLQRNGSKGQYFILTPVGSYKYVNEEGLPFILDLELLNNADAAQEDIGRQEFQRNRTGLPLG